MVMVNMSLRICVLIYTVCISGWVVAMWGRARSRSLDFFIYLLCKPPKEYGTQIGTITE